MKPRSGWRLELSRIAIIPGISMSMTTRTSSHARKCTAPTATRNPKRTSGIMNGQLLHDAVAQRSYPVHHLTIKMKRSVSSPNLALLAFTTRGAHHPERPGWLGNVQPPFFLLASISSGLQPRSGYQQTLCCSCSANKQAQCGGISPRYQRGRRP